MEMVFDPSLQVNSYRVMITNHANVLAVQRKVVLLHPITGSHVNCKENR